MKVKQANQQKAKPFVALIELAEMISYSKRTNKNEQIDVLLMSRIVNTH